MLASPDRRDDASRRRAIRRSLVTLTGACVLAAAIPAIASSAGGAYRLTRSDVPLRVDRGTLGGWSPLKARPRATIGFRSAGSRTKVLRLSDAPGAGGYVVVTKLLSPKTVISVNAEISLVRQRLRRGKVRALLAVAGRDGSSYQAGVYRAPAGHLRWAIWTKNAAGGVRHLRVSKLARPGGFHKLGLASRWGGARSRAVLSVDGTVVARTPRLKRAAAGTRVILGLGRVSKKTETGLMLVRSARISAAVPTAIGGRAPTAPAPPPAATTLPGKQIFRGDFETGGLGQWGGLQRVATDRITVVRSPVRQGSYAARFEVRNGDNPIGYGDRAEVQALTGESEGDERWYSWSTMLAADYPSSSAWQVITQWHATVDGSPPLGFYVSGDNILLEANRYSGPGGSIGTSTIWRGPARRGQWQDIKMHVKWSGSDSVGFVELWIDGARQTFDDGSTHRAIRTLVPGADAYLKQGLYRQSGVPGTGVVYHDGLQVTSAG